MEKVLVIGATGGTGNKVVNLLKESNVYEPVAMVRKESQLNKFQNQGIEVVQADLEGDISHAFKNVDKVIFAAGSNGKKIKQVDLEGARKAIDGAKKNNVNKFVMLSSMGARNPEQGPAEMQDYFKAKQSSDEYLNISGLRFAIVRPGSLTDGNSTGKIKLERKLEGQGEISRHDVAKVIVRSLETDLPKDVAFEIVKGENTIEEAVASLQLN